MVGAGPRTRRRCLPALRTHTRFFLLSADCPDMQSNRWRSTSYAASKTHSPPRHLGGCESDQRDRVPRTRGSMQSGSPRSESIGSAAPLSTRRASTARRRQRRSDQGDRCNGRLRGDGRPGSAIRAPDRSAKGPRRGRPTIHARRSRARRGCSAALHVAPRTVARSRSYVSAVMLHSGAAQASSRSERLSGRGAAALSVKWRDKQLQSSLTVPLPRIGRTLAGYELGASCFCSQPEAAVHDLRPAQLDCR